MQTHYVRYFGAVILLIIGVSLFIADMVRVKNGTMKKAFGEQWKARFFTDMLIVLVNMILGMHFLLF